MYITRFRSVLLSLLQLAEHKDTPLTGAKELDEDLITESSGSEVPAGASVASIMANYATDARA